jgi:phage terminase small subunit
MPLPSSLTAQQQTFVSEYIKSGNPVQAVQVAYPGTAPENLRRMASYVLERRAVRAAIAEQRGEMEVLTKDFLLEQLWDVVKKGRNDMARVRAIELAAEIAGIVQPSSRKKGKFLPVTEDKPPVISSDLARRIADFEKQEKSSTLA